MSPARALDPPHAHGRLGRGAAAALPGTASARRTPCWPSRLSRATSRSRCGFSPGLRRRDALDDVVGIEPAQDRLGLGGLGAEHLVGIDDRLVDAVIGRRQHVVIRQARRCAGRNRRWRRRNLSAVWRVAGCAGMVRQTSLSRSAVPSRTSFDVPPSIERTADEHGDRRLVEAIRPISRALSGVTLALPRRSATQTRRRTRRGSSRRA